MAKQVNKRSNKKTVSQNHVFRGCRDVVLGMSAASGSTPAKVLTDNSGGYSLGFPLAPLGLTTATSNATTYTAGTLGNVFPPSLRGLYNKSLDFQWYRVTRAKLIFVGNVGSAAYGQLTLAGYTDACDVSTQTSSGFVSSGIQTKTFDLASSTTRELSVSIPVDSAWKKVTSILNVPGQFPPFNGSNTAMLVPVNSVADLCFGGCSCVVVGAASVSTIGNLYVEYDVEFKGLIDSSVNL